MSGRDRISEDSFIKVRANRVTRTEVNGRSEPCGVCAAAVGARALLLPMNDRRDANTLPLIQDDDCSSSTSSRSAAASVSDDGAPAQAGPASLEAQIAAAQARFAAEQAARAASAPTAWPSRPAPVESPDPRRQRTRAAAQQQSRREPWAPPPERRRGRSEEHTS